MCLLGCAVCQKEGNIVRMLCVCAGSRTRGSRLSWAAESARHCAVHAGLQYSRTALGSQHQNQLDMLYAVVQSVIAVAAKPCGRGGAKNQPLAAAAAAAPKGVLAPVPLFRYIAAAHALVCAACGCESTACYQHANS